MIHVERIHANLASLTGEAVKLAVHLCVLGAEPIRADKRWCARVAKKIGLSGAGVAKAAKELAKARLVTLRNRVNLAPVDDPLSPPGRSLARVSSPDRPHGQSHPVARHEDENLPPWIREKGERSESQGRGGEGPRDDEGARDLQAEPCPKASPSPHREVVESIDLMYAQKYNARASWGPKQGSIVKALLKQHPAAEIIRRARIMFFEPRRWPSPPYDVGTLSVHFDKFAVSRAGGMVGDASKTGAGYYGEVDDVE